MPSLLRSMVIGCAATVASAKWTKRGDETERWEPARETDGVTNQDPAGWSPKPTPAPGAAVVEMELMKRAGTSTCGYYAGYSSSAAVVCQGTAQCIVNNDDRAMGCCRSSDIDDCVVPTACIPSSLATSLGSILDYTILCTSSAYPNCVTYAYDQYDPLYYGYSALGCGQDAGVYSVEYYAPILGSALTTTRATSSSSSRTSASSSKSTTAPNVVASTSGTTSSTSSSTGSLAGQTSSATTDSDQSSKTPVGAIVGGVVGGIGGLALLAFGIFFLVRHQKKKNKNGSTPPPAAPVQNNAYYSPGPGSDPSTYTQTPHMAQSTQQQFAGYPPAGFAAGDHRTSMAPSTYYDPYSTKSPQYDMSTAQVSPTGSPPPAGYTPPLAGGQQPQYQPYNTPQTQQYQSHDPHHGHAAELPTGRPDGELRELA